MATVTFPISNTPVPCAKIAYSLPADNASAMLTAISTAVVTDLGWNLVDTVGTTYVYMNTFDLVDRYVAVEVDFTGTTKKINITGYGDWDAVNHEPIGDEYLPQRHTVNLGVGTYAWAVFVYEHPTSTMFLEFCNRS